jgi:hypothetical protein
MNSVKTTNIFIGELILWDNFVICGKIVLLNPIWEDSSSLKKMLRFPALLAVYLGAKKVSALFF